MTTIRDALHAAQQALADRSPSPRLDAEVLLAHVLGVERVYLLAEGRITITPEQEAAFRALIHRRAELEPVAYLVGHKAFYGLDFVVDPRVLVPRPETELIVDLALRWAGQRRAYDSTPLTIADIGTGSGCLAVTLAHHLPDASVYAVDLSVDALAVARINAEQHSLTNRIVLLHGAGCTPLPQPVDLLVTNPPYTILAEVDENVRRWEPHLALDSGGADGFTIPAQLLRELPPYLRSGALVLMEIGAWQGAQARSTAAAVFPQARITIHQDLAGHDRTLEIAL